MCTSFVYRKSGIWVGMNFDLDGTAFKVAADGGGDFLVSVKSRGTYFPSFGVNKAGLFVNDLMVPPNEAGRYKRQSDKRWITTSLIQYIMAEDAGFEDVKALLGRVVIVNAPGQSTHNLIMDRHGNTCIVEPGRKILYSEPDDSDWVVMTNFPLSEYDDIVPATVSGDGADRYLTTLESLAALDGPMSVEDGFDVLKRVAQAGPEWKTELSILYDAGKRELYYCVDRRFDAIEQVDLGS